MSVDINTRLFITHAYTWPAIDKSHPRLETEQCIRPELSEHGACWHFLTRYGGIKFSFKIYNIKNILVSVWDFYWGIINVVKFLAHLSKKYIYILKKKSKYANKMIHMHLLNGSFKAAAATLISFMQTAVSIRATSYSGRWAIFLFKTENSK